MPGRGDVLREVMRETRTTQSCLSRLSGVRQPSISQFLSGKVDLSDEQLDRLLSCMGYRLEVVRRPVIPDLTRSERRSWRLHRQLSNLLTKRSLEEWRPVIERNLRRLRSSVTGQPHCAILTGGTRSWNAATCSACTASLPASTVIPSKCARSHP